MRYDKILNALQIETEPFALCELRGACDLGLGQDGAATLHYVLSGKGEITLRGRPPLPVEAGSLVLVPALCSHALRSHGGNGLPVPQCAPAELSLSSLMAGGATQAAGLTALCAHVSVGIHGAGNVIELIQSPLAVSVADGPELNPLVDALLREIAYPAAGGVAMLRAILSQAILLMLRHELDQPDSALTWIDTVQDGALWKALKLMLARPGDPHTVESLATEAGLSRSSFAQRFSEAHGAGPMELLRSLRMRQAARMLRETDLPVKRIAAFVGFSSRSAFTRAFESETGTAPRSFRRGSC